MGRIDAKVAFSSNHFIVATYRLSNGNLYFQVVVACADTLLPYLPIHLRPGPTVSPYTPLYYNEKMTKLWKVHAEPLVHTVRDT